MQFRIPGTQLQVRAFERVKTVDTQYDVFDLGVQHNNGDIDSVVVGGSFATVKNWAKSQDDKAAKKAAKKAKKAAAKKAESTGTAEAAA